jgi:hypothetical protein
MGERSREPLRSPRNPLWQFRAQRVGGRGILGIDGRDVLPFRTEDVEYIRNWAKQAKARGPGRPHVEYHQRWAVLFREFYANACEYLEFSPVDGELPPSKLGVAELVAIEDYAAHPEDWKYNPNENLGNAARMVLKAVKPLI